MRPILRDDDLAEVVTRGMMVHEAKFAREDPGYIKEWHIPKAWIIVRDAIRQWRKGLAPEPHQQELFNLFNRWKGEGRLR